MCNNKIISNSKLHNNNSNNKCKMINSILHYKLLNTFLKLTMFTSFNNKMLSNHHKSKLKFIFKIWLCISFILIFN